MSQEIWSLEIKVGNMWMSRKMTLTEACLMEQSDIYVGRALEGGYEVRIVPYVVDESRIKMLEPATYKKA